MNAINRKRRIIIGWILSGLACAVIVFSGINKLAGSNEMIESLDKINLGKYVRAIGLIEILCVIVYLVPRTSNIGFFLLCSYVGGIIVAEWGMGYPPGLGIIVAIFIYCGTLLRKPELTGLYPQSSIQAQ